MPSQTTHVPQPLDMSTFKPLKEAYDKVAHSFFHTHQRYINKRDFPAILVTAWKAFKPEMAINGFRTTGILPFNKDTIEASSIHLSAPYQYHSQANEDQPWSNYHHTQKNHHQQIGNSWMILWNPTHMTLILLPLLGDGVQEVTELLHNYSGAVSSHSAPPTYSVTCTSTPSTNSKCTKYFYDILMLKHTTNTWNITKHAYGRKPST